MAEALIRQLCMVGQTWDCIVTVVPVVEKGFQRFKTSSNLTGPRFASKRYQIPGSKSYMKLLQHQDAPMLLLNCILAQYDQEEELGQ